MEGQSTKVITLQQNDFLIIRLNELKTRHDAHSKRKSEAKQLVQNTADPIRLSK
ncbi:hypothetical protein [Paenibacillus sp. sgz5001063]|uniref:hypothetical protein n=1 Tax=Paenibacillus sp. sgz5001063 TaxID=3242474 RepID=UPI0036D25BE5